MLPTGTLCPSPGHPASVCPSRAQLLHLFSPLPDPRLQLQALHIQREAPAAAPLRVPWGAWWQCCPEESVSSKRGSQNREALCSHGLFPLPPGRWQREDSSCIVPRQIRARRGREVSAPRGMSVSALSTEKAVEMGSSCPIPPFGTWVRTSESSQCWKGSGGGVCFPPAPGNTVQK